MNLTSWREDWTVCGLSLTFLREIECAESEVPRAYCEVQIPNVFD